MAEHYQYDGCCPFCEEYCAEPYWKLREKFQKLHDFVSDIESHGLRTDMHPTMLFNPDEAPNVYARLTNYFSRSEENLRQRAREALNG